MKLLKTEIRQKIGIITFNNYQKRNALSHKLLEELIETIMDMEKKVRVIILRAEKGVKVWSAGHDVSELPQPGCDPLSYFNPLETALRTIERSPVPIIAMVEGGVWGGACELAFTCDILIGCESASFSITPAKIGVPYNPTGILHFINILGVNLIKEMFFTAEPIKAERALSLGILNHLVKGDELEDFTLKMAERICKNSPLSISVIKEQMRILGKAHPLSPDAFERIQELRRRVFESRDYREGMEAFLEKRSPVFNGD